MYVLDLTNSTENLLQSELINLETQLVDFQHQLMNTSTTLYNHFFLDNFNIILPYLAAAGGVLGLIACFFPCFIPSLACSAIRTMQSIIWQFLCCLRCQKNKKTDKFNKLDIVEVDKNDKSEKLITA